VLSTYETTTRRLTVRFTTAEGVGLTYCWSRPPEFAAQSIKKVHDLGWSPLFFMTNVAILCRHRDGAGGGPKFDWHDQHNI